MNSRRDRSGASFGVRAGYILLLLLGGPTSACDLLTGAADGGLTIDGGTSLELPWGDTLTLTVRDGGGSVVRGDRVGWSSDQPAIATVSPGGVVSGEGIGSTTIRAEFAGEQASIRVQVVVEGAEDIMHIRVTGDLEEEYLIYPGSGPYSFAVGLQAEFPDRPAWGFGYLLGETYSLADDRVGGVIFALPGELAVGIHPLTAPVLEDLAQSSLIDLAGPIGYLFRETSDRSFYVYRLSQGTLEITELNNLGVSFTDGSVRGRASFSGDEFVEAYDSDARSYTPVPTGRSVQVDVVFHIPAGIYYGGYMDVGVSGGTYGAEERIEGWADGYVDPNFGTAFELGARDSSGDLVNLAIGMETVAVGTHSVGAGVAVRWSQLAGARYLEAGGADGTVLITEYVRPTATAWGLARGTMDLGLLVTETSAQGVDDTVAVAGSFSVPIAPVSANVASGAAPDQRSSPVLLRQSLRQFLTQMRLPASPDVKAYMRNR